MFWMFKTNESGRPGQIVRLINTGLDLVETDLGLGFVFSV